MAAVLVLAFLVILYQFSVYFYNAFLHPLRHVPGPFLWRISRIPHELALACGRIHYAICDMHEQYGDVVRVSPDGLSFADPDAWNEIMVRNQKDGKGNQIPVKDMLRFSDALRVNGAMEMLTADSKTHSRQRRIFAPAFSEKSLVANSEPLLQRHVDTLLGQLKKRLGQKLDMTKWASLYNFEVVSDFALGEPLNCLRDGDYHPWTRLLFESVVTMTILGSIQQFPWLQATVDLILKKYMNRLIRQHHLFVVERVGKRLQVENQTRGDLFDQVLAHNKYPDAMSHDELMSNSNLMIAAGSDTTGAALTSCIFFLAMNPDACTKLTAEIRDSFQDITEINIESTAKLPFLEACIKESLRMHPPNPNSNPRRGCREGSQVCGIWINQKISVLSMILGGSETSLGIYQWAANHYSRNFTNPHKFDPSRWLSNPAYGSDRRAIAKPFSVGSSNCIGQSLAMILIRIALCRIYYEFDLDILNESVDWLNRPAYWVWKKEPLWIQLKERPGDTSSSI